jgi:hypothetical protein
MRREALTIERPGPERGEFRGRGARHQASNCGKSGENRFEMRTWFSAPMARPHALGSKGEKK